MTLEPSVQFHRGFQWNLYSAEFDSPDGRFGFYLYAVSDSHAQLQLDAIREGARLIGRVDSVVEIYKEHP